MPERTAFGGASGGLYANGANKFDIWDQEQRHGSRVLRNVSQIVNIDICRKCHVVIRDDHHACASDVE